MAYKVAVCDDAVSDREYVSTLVSKWAERNGLAISLSVFSSAERFLFQFVDESDFDIQCRNRNKKHVYYLQDHKLAEDF